MGTWFSGDNSEDYPFFIVEKGFCYFSPDHKISTHGEKYKYTFDSRTNILTCYQYDYDDDIEFMISVNDNYDEEYIICNFLFKVNYTIIQPNYPT